MHLTRWRLARAGVARARAEAEIGGLVTSTVFTLLALPAFYQLVHDLARAGAGAAPERRRHDRIGRHAGRRRV